MKGQHSEFIAAAWLISKNYLVYFATFIIEQGENGDNRGGKEGMEGAKEEGDAGRGTNGPPQ